MKYTISKGQGCLAHDNIYPHRQITKGNDADVAWFQLGGLNVSLTQMQPRGLWRFTSTFDSEIDRQLDEKYGEMPLKVAVAKLKLLA